MILVLAGCGSLGLTSTTPPKPEVELAIEGIEPSWGYPSDETEVVITGSGLETATAVKFGRSEVSFSEIDGDLAVTAPALGFEAVVDVTVVTPDGEVTATGGFTYADEEPEDTDTGSGDTDDNTDADGQIGGLVQMTLVQYACPTCFEPALPDLDVYANAAFHAPTRAGWLDWLPAEGSCASNPGGSAPASSFVDAGEYAYLTSGSRAIAMRAASDHVFASSGLDEADYVRNAAYDLDVDGGSGLDAFEVTDAVTTPQSISSLTPAELLYTNPRDAFSAQIRKTNATFTWGPTGGGGSFVVEVQVYSGSSGSALGSVICRGPDDGSLTVPASSLSSYPSGSLLVVGLHRYVIGTFDRPDNGSEVDTLASFGVVGTGVLQ